MISSSHENCIFFFIFFFFDIDFCNRISLLFSSFFLLLLWCFWKVHCHPDANDAPAVRVGEDVTLRDDPGYDLDDAVDHEDPDDAKRLGPSVRAPSGIPPLAAPDNRTNRTGWPALQTAYDDICRMSSSEGRICKLRSLNFPG